MADLVKIAPGIKTIITQIPPNARAIVGGTIRETVAAETRVTV